MSPWSGCRSFDHCPLGSPLCAAAERVDSMRDASSEPVMAGGRNIHKGSRPVDLFISPYRFGQEHDRVPAVAEA